MEDDDQGGQEQRVVGAPRLKPANIWQTRMGNALRFQPAPEILVGKENAEPVEHGEDSDEADEVAEHNRRQARRIHIGQSDEE